MKQPTHSNHGERITHWIVIKLIDKLMINGSNEMNKNYKSSKKEVYRDYNAKSIVLCKSSVQVACPLVQVACPLVQVTYLGANLMVNFLNSVYFKIK